MGHPIEARYLVKVLDHVWSEVRQNDVSRANLRHPRLKSGKINMGAAALGIAVGLADEEIAACAALSSVSDQGASPEYVTTRFAAVTRTLLEGEPL